MKDLQNSKKSHLNEELEELRQLVEERDLESAASDTEGKVIPRELITRPPRGAFHGDIEFIGDFDIVKAKGINLSEGGICFELSEALPFEMKLMHEGKILKFRAHLTWIKKLPAGGYRFGLKFVRPEPHPVF
jgi:hypothetical protein